MQYCRKMASSQAASVVFSQQYFHTQRDPPLSCVHAILFPLCDGGVKNGISAASKLRAWLRLPDGVQPQGIARGDPTAFSPLQTLRFDNLPQKNLKKLKLVQTFSDLQIMSYN